MSDATDPAPQTAVTIGSFDGVHLGHAALVRRARELVGPAGRVVALAFSPSPRAVLRPAEAPPELTTVARRAELLRAGGADEVLRLEPDTELLGFTPRRFFAYIAELFRPAFVVEGEDFRFGRGRAGDVAGLAALGPELGFRLEVVPEVDVALADQTVHRAGSTLARALVAAGRVADAAAVLGRPHELSGTVSPGDRRGRRIGFPTANLRPHELLPADGVYAGLATLPNGRRLPAAINVGERPTVDGHERRVEAHLLSLDTSFDPDRTAGDAPAWHAIAGLDEYAWPIRLHPVAWLRDQVRFGSIDELVAQLARDCRRAAAVLRDRDRGLAPARPVPDTVAP